MACSDYANGAYVSSFLKDTGLAANGLSGFAVAKADVQGRYRGRRDW